MTIYSMSVWFVEINVLLMFWKRPQCMRWSFNSKPIGLFFFQNVIIMLFTINVAFLYETYHEYHEYFISTVVTDGLVLKHQDISSHINIGEYTCAHAFPVVYGLGWWVIECLSRIALLRCLVTSEYQTDILSQWLLDRQWELWSGNRQP